MKLNTKNNNALGAVFVEFAIGALLFFVLLFGLIDLGWMYHRRSEQEYAANQVAQLAAVTPGLEDILASGGLALDTDQAAIESLYTRAAEVLKESDGVSLGKNFEYIPNPDLSEFAGVKRSDSILLDSNGQRTTGSYVQVRYPICQANQIDSNGNCLSDVVNGNKRQINNLGYFSYFLPAKMVDKNTGNANAKTNPTTNDLKEGLKNEPIITSVEITQDRSFLVKMFGLKGTRMKVFASAYRELSQNSNMPAAIGCDGKPLVSGKQPASCPVTTTPGLNCKFDKSTGKYTNCSCDTSLHFKKAVNNKGECVCEENYEFNVVSGGCDCALKCDSSQGSYLNSERCNCQVEYCGDNIIYTGDERECNRCLCEEGQGGVIVELPDGSLSCNCNVCGANEVVIDGSCVCEYVLHGEKTQEYQKECAEDEVLVADEEGCRCAKCGEHSRFVNGECVCDDGYSKSDDVSNSCDECDSELVGTACNTKEVYGKKAKASGYGPCKSYNGIWKCNEKDGKKVVECVAQVDKSKAKDQICCDDHDPSCPNLNCSPDSYKGRLILCCKNNTTDNLAEDCELHHGYYANSCPKSKPYKRYARDYSKDGTDSTYICKSDSSQNGVCSMRQFFCKTNTTEFSCQNIYNFENQKDVPDDDCDGKDDNCDGQVDEDAQPISCSLDGSEEEFGAEGSDCRKGQIVCQENKWSECQQTVKPGDNEEVCDGIDNDCDGQIDEGLQNCDLVCGNGENGSHFVRDENGECVCEKEWLINLCGADNKGIDFAHCSCGELCKDGAFTGKSGTCIKCGDNTTGTPVEKKGKLVCECDNTGGSHFVLDGEDKCTCKPYQATICAKTNQILDMETCECMSGCEGVQRDYYANGKVSGYYCNQCKKDEKGKCKGNGKCTDKQRQRCVDENGGVFNERNCTCYDKCNDDMTGIDECTCPVEFMKLVDGTCKCPVNASYDKTKKTYKCSCDPVKIKFEEGKYTMSELQMANGVCSCNVLDCNNANAPLKDQVPQTDADGRLICNCGRPCGDKAIADGDECIECVGDGVAVKDPESGKYVCGCEGSDVNYNPETGCTCTEEQDQAIGEACVSAGHPYVPGSCKCDFDIPCPYGCGYTAEQLGGCPAGPEPSGQCIPDGMNETDEFCPVMGKEECRDHKVVCVPSGAEPAAKKCPGSTEDCQKEPECVLDPSAPSGYRVECKETAINCCEDNNNCEDTDPNDYCSIEPECKEVTNDDGTISKRWECVEIQDRKKCEDQPGAKFVDCKCEFCAVTECPDTDVKCGGSVNVDTCTCEYKGTFTVLNDDKVCVDVETGEQVLD